MTPTLSPAIFITPSPLRVTTDQDHPMFSSQDPTGYTAKTNIRNPEILNTLNSANHLPRGECNNMDFADSALVFAARAGYSSLGPAQPQQTFVCFLLISRRSRDTGGGMPLLSLSNVNDIKIGGWQFGAGWSSSVDLLLSDRQVRGDKE